MTPNDPTLTCSEVVEMLAKIAESWLLPYPEEPIGDKAHNQCANSIANHIRLQAPRILHSWRERRVQELEEALREVLSSATPNEKEHPTMFAAWTKAEQIRKGAKHESDL